MAQVSGNQLFDAWKKTRENLVLATSSKQAQQYALVLIEQVFTKGKAASKANPFLVCAINREKPEIHRWMNLAMTIDSKNIHPRQHGCLEYAGALACAEALLDGAWYIASPEEEAACIVKDRKERDEAIARNSNEQAGKDVGKLLSGLSKLAENQTKLEPALAGVGGGSESKKK